MVPGARYAKDGEGKYKQRLPRCKTVLGISNVSFGLPTAGREVLNSVFLYHCVQAGLDLAVERELAFVLPSSRELWRASSAT